MELRRPVQSKRPAVACASAFVASAVLVIFGDDILPSSNSSSGSSFRGLVKDALSPPPQSGIERGVIFYNIYMPPSDRNPTKHEMALSIVKEQMAMVDASERARDMPIRYGLIGEEAASDKIEEICRGRDTARRRDCEQVAHREAGNEFVTLQPLYEYCRLNPTKWVTYMHNKGSFHPSPENDVMRRMITKAALSDECQTVTADKCNVCSNRFTPLPFLHSSGNHWTASCEYVSELIPPMYFFPAMEELFDEKVQEVLSWINDGKGWRDMYPKAQGDDKAEDKATEEGNEGGKSPPTSIKRFLKPSVKYVDATTFTGRGRFAMEHWVLSHPRQKPCDVYPGKYAWGHTDLPAPPGDDWTPVLRTAADFPRFGTLELFVIPPFAEAMEDPWYCRIESRLFEFKRLYGEEPPKDSWVWSFYKASEEYCKGQIASASEGLTSTSVQALAPGV